MLRWIEKIYNMYVIDSKRGIPMNLINIEKITKSYTDRKLFDDASFSLQEGEKVGIIGINGTGKTTLLKMIAGLESKSYCDSIFATASGIFTG